MPGRGDQAGTEASRVIHRAEGRRDLQLAAVARPRVDMTQLHRAGEPRPAPACPAAGAAARSPGARQATAARGGVARLRKLSCQQIHDCAGRHAGTAEARAGNTGSAIRARRAAHAGQGGTGMPADGRSQPAAGPLRAGELLDEALTAALGPVDASPTTRSPGYATTRCTPSSGRPSPARCSRTGGCCR